jgi:hypothetical protein
MTVGSLSSHTSADLQPLDTTAFHPVKAGTRRALKRVLMETGSQTWTLGISPNIWKRLGMRELRRRQYVQAFNPVADRSFDAQVEDHSGLGQQLPGGH